MSVSWLLHDTTSLLIGCQRYTWVIVMGALWELLAFVFRLFQTRQQNNESWATAHTVLFLLAPLCTNFPCYQLRRMPWLIPDIVGINAFLYMTVGRLIYFFIPDKRLAGITAERYGQLFVWLDILAFIVQAVGAVMTSDTQAGNAEIMRGVHIYMGGIGLQELFILIFVSLAIHLHHRMLTMERLGQLDDEKVHRGGMPWRWLFYATYAALGMITVSVPGEESSF